MRRTIQMRIAGRLPEENMSGSAPDTCDDIRFPVVVGESGGDTRSALARRGIRHADPACPGGMSGLRVHPCAASFRSRYDPVHPLESVVHLCASHLFDFLLAVLLRERGLRLRVWMEDPPDFGLPTYRLCGCGTSVLSVTVRPGRTEASDV